MKQRLLISSGLTFLLFLISTLAYSQPDSIRELSHKENQKIRITPGKKYDANWINRILSGEHWRDLWITEIDAEVLDMNNFAGGLNPLKKGGGLQTKTLRFRGNNNNEYKFRSIDKDPWKSLPPEWQNSLYAEQLQDQVSIGLPVASLIVYPLMKDVGILSVEPKIVVLPQSDKLVSFKKEFGGVLGIIELNPRGGKEGINNFADADKVVNGFEIFKKVEKDNDEQVDQREFLKARLMDVFIGDRDRHADQWQWAGYKENGKRIWKPIPRDRDYAFGMYDGLFPWASGLFAHSLLGFNKDIPQLTEITWTGRHLDRRFLNELDKPVWDSVAKFLANTLTDGDIRNAVKKMPMEMYAKSGEKLFGMLKNRRGQLLEAAEDYYEIYSDVVDVYGSDKKEYAEVEILNDNQLEVRLYKRDKESGNKKGDPFYRRKFSNNYTNEIRLHLLDGDDVIFINGKNDNNILLRVISGKGKDKIINKSEMKIKLYDSDNKNKITGSDKIYFNDDKIIIPKENLKKYEPSIEDRYSFPAFTPVLNYNSDDGFILGGGPNFTQHGFRANPYLYFLELTGAYATIAKDYDVKFYADFNKLIHNSRVQFFLRASELDFNRYYGSGNETKRNPDLALKNFYKADQQNITFEPKVLVIISKNFKLNFSFLYKYSDVNEKNNSNNLIGDTRPYGFGKISGMSFSTGFTFNNLDNFLSPKKGFYTLFNFSYFPKFLDYKIDFNKIYGEVTGFFNIKTFTDIKIMLKAGGQKNSGMYPFFEAAALGGTNSLRGYSRERFQGDAMLFGQSELKIKIADVNVFLPAIFGISGISDAGRVFVREEESKKWHSTYGGGVWLEIINALVLNFTIARSPELTKYYFSFNFGF